MCVYKYIHIYVTTGETQHIFMFSYQDITCLTMFSSSYMCTFIMLYTITIIVLICVYMYNIKCLEMLSNRKHRPSDMYYKNHCL